MNLIKENLKNKFDDIFFNQQKKMSVVSDVFTTVASKYDIMNDIMSFKTHILWKTSFVDSINIKNGMNILDLSSGSGDIALLLLKKAQKLGKSIITERKLPIDWLLEAVKYEEKSIPRLHNRVFKLTIIEKIDASLDKSFIEDLKKDPKAWKEFEAMGEACYALVRVLLAVDRD